MGLFDGVFNNVVNTALGDIRGLSQNSNELTHAMTLIQDHGGLQNVIAMFNQSGLAREAKSWVGNGQNLPITAEQVQQVFNSTALQKIASGLNVSPQQVSTIIANVLPQVINHLTPQGAIPENHSDLLAQGLAMLRQGNA